MDSEVIAGKILYAIKNGARTFKDLELRTKLATNTITKYTYELAREGLLFFKSNRDRRKVIYELNESRIDEINKLIEAYLEYKKKELKENMEFAMHYIDFTEEEKKEIAELVEKLKKKLGV